MSNSESDEPPSNLETITSFESFDLDRIKNKGRPSFSNRPATSLENKRNSSITVRPTNNPRASTNRRNSQLTSTCSTNSTASLNSAANKEQAELASIINAAFGRKNSALSRRTSMALSRNGNLPQLLQKSQPLKAKSHKHREKSDVERILDTTRVRTEEMRAKAREYWQIAFISIKKLKKATMIFKVPKRKDNLMIVDADTFSQKSMKFLLRALGNKNEVSSTTRVYTINLLYCLVLKLFQIQMFLEKPVEQRTEADLVNIEKLLTVLLPG